MARDEHLTKTQRLHLPRCAAAQALVSWAMTYNVGQTKGVRVKKATGIVFVLAMILVLSGGSGAVELSELGLWITVSHDPTLIDGRIKPNLTISAYAEVHTVDDWTVTVSAGMPTTIFAPWVALTAGHDVGTRWSADAYAVVQGTPGSFLILNLSGRGTVQLGEIGDVTVSLSSYPFAITGLYQSDDWSFHAAFSPNLDLGCAWAATERLMFAQQVGLSISRFDNAPAAYAIPFGNSHGIILRSGTRIGIRSK